MVATGEESRSKTRSAFDHLHSNESLSVTLQPWKGKAVAKRERVQVMDSQGGIGPSSVDSQRCQETIDRSGCVDALSL
jgi:hypothetical protein